MLNRIKKKIELFICIKMDLALKLFNVPSLRCHQNPNKQTNIFSQGMF